MKSKDKSRKYYWKRRAKFHEEVEKEVDQQIKKILKSKSFTERLGWLLKGKLM